MALELKNLHFTYKGAEKETIRGIDLKLESGSFTVISGPNGSGKTTLSKLLCGILKPTLGSIDADGVGILFQVPENQLFQATVLEDVMFGPLNFGRTRDQAREDAIRALESVGIGEEFYSRDPFRLSDGQKRLVALAGVLACGFTTLVLDEVAAGLDWKTEQKVFEILKNLQKSGMTIIVISHDPGHAQYADRYLHMKGGVLSDGVPDPDILTLIEKDIHFFPEI